MAIGLHSGILDLDLELIGLHSGWLVDNAVGLSFGASFGAFWLQLMEVPGSGHAPGSLRKGFIPCPPSQIRFGFPDSVDLHYCPWRCFTVYGVELCEHPTLATVSKTCRAIDLAKKPTAYFWEGPGLGK